MQIVPNSPQRMSEEKYVEDKGQMCPFCRSPAKFVEGRTVNVDGNYLKQEMQCLHCDRKWEDVYKLCGYQQ